MNAFGLCNHMFCVPGLSVKLADAIVHSIDLFDEVAVHLIEQQLHCRVVCSRNLANHLANQA